MTVTIERDIPIPDGPPRKKKSQKYPFAEMNVGDSIAIPGIKNPGPVVRRARKDNKPNRYQLRQLDGVWRIWRIS